MRMREMKRHKCALRDLQREDVRNDLSARYFRQEISGRAGIKLSNLSIRCNHQRVTFRACAVNLQKEVWPGDEAKCQPTSVVGNENPCH